LLDDRFARGDGGAAGKSALDSLPDRARGGGSSPNSESGVGELVRADPTRRMALSRAVHKGANGPRAVPAWCV